MKTELRKPCVECPFRKKHLPGWLGPWEANDLILHVHRDGAFPCHRTIKKDIPESEMQSCAGATIHMNRSIKRSKNADHAAHQAILKDAPPEIVESVFEWQKDFIKHHTQDMATWLKKKKET